MEYFNVVYPFRHLNTVPKFVLIANKTQLLFISLYIYHIIYIYKTETFNIGTTCGKKASKASFNIANVLFFKMLHWSSSLLH